METVVKAKVKSVTVYPEQARVSLRAELSLSLGSESLIFDELPTALVRDSVRFSGKGAAQVRIHSVDLMRVHYEQTPSDTVRELEESIKKVEDDLAILEDEQEVLDAQATYLSGLLEATDHYARGLSIGRTKVEDQVELAKSIRIQDTEIRTATRALVLEERMKREQLDKLERELDELQSARRKSRYQAKVDIEVLSAGSFFAELTYVVREARWTPLYDARLEDEDGSYSLQVTNIAEVTQTTGQDWMDVELVLSTARTALSQRLPELKPWYLDQYRPPQLVSSQGPKRARAPRMQAPVAGMVAANIEPTEAFVADAAVAVARSDQGHSVASFRVESKVGIPSDGSPHKTTIGQFSLPSEVDYLAIPRHTDAIYRRVKAINDGPGPLLGGQVALFVDDEYIGKTFLKYVPKGDEIELLLGVEERLTIERELDRREVDKVRLRDKRQLLFGYEIQLKNLMAHEVKIELQDSMPVPRHEDIKVKLVGVEPDPDEQSDLNIFTWNLKVPSGSEPIVSYEFQVEHPRSMAISGLLD